MSFENSLQQPASEKPKEQISPKTLKELRAKSQKDGGIILYHGGLPKETTLGDIDLNFRAKQNRRGKTYGGFYLTHKGLFTESAIYRSYVQQRGGTMHGFLIKKSARIGELDDVIDRLSQEQRNEYAKYFDILKGADVLGRPQYALLNKDVIEDFGYEIVI